MTCVASVQLSRELKIQNSHGCSRQHIVCNTWSYCSTIVIFHPFFIKVFATEYMNLYRVWWEKADYIWFISIFPRMIWYDFFSPGGYKVFVCILCGNVCSTLLFFVFWITALFIDFVQLFSNTWKSVCVNVLCFCLSERNNYV